MKHDNRPLASVAMSQNLLGQVALVTGGAKGIGRAIALALAEEGASVAIFDLDDDVSGLAHEFVSMGRGIESSYLYQRVDMTRSSDIKSGVMAVLEQFRRIDVLINNVGGGMDPVPLEDLEEQDWERILRLNLTSMYLCTRAVIKTMKSQRRGRVINISSQAGRSKSELSNLPYASAKAGVLGFTRQLASELAPHGITVNAIAPGLVLSGERVGRRWEARPEEEREQRLGAIPLGRLGTAEEVAAVAVFLASDGASYMTGATLDVNGGRHMA